MVANPEFERLEQYSEALRAIAHPIRLAIINLLQDGRPRSVTDIHERLQIEQAAASHHLKILRYNGIVHAQREGRHIFYLVSDETYPQILELLKTADNFSTI
ncbi:MAG: winged helix-turn-helix transcriptional regulator [Phaeodactylibacter sp.]|nr:winged helix-turn-helix transcriptional regulator [Phaeodactylibacter sp.]MCB9049715.1 winged helix-turn-helix transcriptional regulator [Lewinellaceae bacterium]